MSFLSKIVDDASDALAGLEDAVVSGAASLEDAVVSSVDSLGDLASTLEGIADANLTYVTGGLNQLESLGSKLGERIGHLGSWLDDRSRSMFSCIEDAFIAAGDEAADLGDRAAEGLDQLIDYALDTGTEILTRAGEAIGQGVGGFLDGLGLGNLLILVGLLIVGAPLVKSLFSSNQNSSPLVITTGATDSQSPSVVSEENDVGDETNKE